MARINKYQDALDRMNKRFEHQGILFIPEHYFLAGQRQWRFDMAVICCKLAIEIEGIGGFNNHRNIGNFAKDMEKYNRANIEGWRMLRFTPNQVNAKTPKFLIQIEDYFITNPCTHQKLNQIIKNLREENS